MDEREQYKTNQKIIEEYWSYSFDSSHAYINKNLEIAIGLKDPILTSDAKMDLALLLASSGSYKQSQDILKSIDRSVLAVDLTAKLHNGYRKIYSDLDYFALQSQARSEYGLLYKQYTDSVIPMIEQSEDDYLYAQEWELLDQNRFDDCLIVNSLRLSKGRVATEKYSYITFQRSTIYEQMGGQLMEQKYLVLSAISVIRASRKDNASLAKLACKLYL